jgi:hypothetical protein
MPQTVNINGVAISYPIIGDTEWGVEATKFAELVGVVLQKIGQGNQSTTNNIVIGSISSPGNLIVASGDLSVSGNTALTGNLTTNGTTNLNGNTNLGNANSDTIAVTGILNVDSGTLYVDPATNKVGINDTTPSEALDVTGNALISGTLGVTGVATLTDLTVDTNVIKTDSTNNRVGINTTSPTVALDVTGNIKASSQIQIPDGTVSVPGISPSTETSSGLYKIATNKLGIAINGSRVGEVGVGYGGFTGNVIQVAYAELTTSTVTSSVSIPVDNTIPQNTEGVEILTCSITPKYANSILYIESNSYIGESANNVDNIVQALFRDSTADAISVSFNNASPPGSSSFGGGLSFNPTYMLARETANSTSSTTFKLRAGGGGSPTTLRVNGTSSQFFNGKLITYIRIIEVQV